MEAQEKSNFIRNTHLCDLVKINYETNLFKKIKQHEISGYVSAITYEGVKLCSKNPTMDKPSIYCNRPKFVKYDKIRDTSRLYENPGLERDEL